MSQTPDEFEQLPRAVLDRLEARDRSVSVVTPRVDETVLALAKAQFAARRVGPGARPRRRSTRWAIPAAVAAAVAVAVSAALLLGPSRAPQTSTAMRLADDVDGSGQVDILDAFALARTAGREPADQRRIDALAARIVSLGPERAL